MRSDCMQWKLRPHRICARYTRICGFDGDRCCFESRLQTNLSAGHSFSSEGRQLPSPRLRMLPLTSKRKMVPRAERTNGTPHQRVGMTFGASHPLLRPVVFLPEANASPNAREHALSKAANCTHSSTLACSICRRRPGSTAAAGKVFSCSALLGIKLPVASLSTGKKMHSLCVLHAHSSRTRTGLQMRAGGSSCTLLSVPMLGSPRSALPRTQSAPVPFAAHFSRPISDMPTMVSSA
jgi:hypothetical protein